MQTMSGRRSKSVLLWQKSASSICRIVISLVPLRHLLVESLVDDSVMERRLSPQTYNTNYMSSTPTIFVLLVCGLPGSGKSHLCQGIQEWVRKAGDDAAMSCQVIDYDDIEHQLLREAQQHEANDNIIPKQALMLSEEEDPNDLQLQAWRLSRTRALEQLQVALTNAASKDLSTQTLSPKPSIILLDDNFYLRSMRKQCYKICQSVVSASSNLHVKIHFRMIYLQTSLETCLDRNRLRLNPVPEHVIRAMAARFESPVSSSISWERSCLCLSNDSPCDFMKTTIDFIETLRNSPTSIVEPLLDPSHELKLLSMEQAKTRASIKHYVDLALRTKCVAVVAKEFPSRGRFANEVRKQVLSTILKEQQHGAIEIGDDAMETAKDSVSFETAAVTLFWQVLGQQQDWTAQEQDTLHLLKTAL
jgi:tRNA uridine 5-carbamoylmethylation protein Kti12